MFKKRSLAILITFAFRFFSAILIYWNPVLGIVVYVLFDSWDTLILEDWGGMGFKDYHRIDKVIDVTTYLILLPIGFRYQIFLPLLALLVFRIVGTFLFYLKRKEYYLIVFPNFFLVYLFFMILVSEKVFVFYNSLSYVFAFVLLFLGQVILEIVYHYIYPNYLTSGLLRRNLSLLGYKKERKL